ncbi:MAG TPA: serine hydrolase [Microlunatus sp.]|nr:serine hydrolase [Microlunatus sp.]
MIRPLPPMILLLALTLTACTAGAGASDQPSAPESSADGPGSTAQPASGPLAPVGDTPPDAYAARPIPPAQIDAAVAGLDTMVAEVMERSGVPGMSVAVVRGGKTVYAKGFGVKKVGEPGKIDPDTVFQLASLSKSIGSTCVSAAVSKGQLAWSDPVTDHLPDFTLSDPRVTQQLTIADLFAHRSGLPPEAGDDLEGFGYDRDHILSRLDEFPLRPFRISYGYSNFGLTTGAEAAAAAAKTPWEKLCADALYTPLKMASTSSSHADFTARENKATLHFRSAEKKFEPLYLRDPDAQSPAGGVSSTANDLASWMIMNLDEGKIGGEALIKPDVLQESHTTQIINGPAETAPSRSRSYGYGFNVETTSTGHVKLGHSGAFYVGAGTAFALLPAADVGIVVLTNGSPVGAAEAITTGFTDLVRTGAVERDWLDFFGTIFGGLFVNRSSVAEPAPAGAKPPRSLDAYVGTYTNDYLGDVVVARSDDRLTVSLGPKKLTAPLTPYDGDTFSWLAPGGNGDPVSAITFAGGGDQATTMEIELVQIPKLQRKE